MRGYTDCFNFWGVLREINTDETYIAGIQRLITTIKMNKSVGTEKTIEKTVEDRNMGCRTGTCGFVLALLALCGFACNRQIG